jgi:hypothetical protein
LHSYRLPIEEVMKSGPFVDGLVTFLALKTARELFGAALLSRPVGQLAVLTDEIDGYWGVNSHSTNMRPESARCQPGHLGDRRFCTGPDRDIRHAAVAGDEKARSRPKPPAFRSHHPCIKLRRRWDAPWHRTRTCQPATARATRGRCRRCEAGNKHRLVSLVSARADRKDQT